MITRTIKDIIIQASIISAITERIALDRDIVFGKKHSLNWKSDYKQLIFDWLIKENLLTYLSEKQIRLFQKDIGKLDADELQIASQYWSIESLTWAISLRKMSSYRYKRIVLGGDEIFMGQDNSVERTLAVSTLRPIQEIHIQKEISMIWHWRCIEYLHYGNSEFKENLKDIITDIFGKDYIEVMDKIQNFNIHKDLMVGKKPFYQITEKQCKEILRISIWRQHAFEWLFSKEDWDDIDVDS